MKKTVQRFAVFVFLLVTLVSAYLLTNRQEFVELAQHPYENTIDDDLVIMRISGDFPFYNSIGDLADRATDVVKVEVLDERVELINIWMPPLYECEMFNYYFERYPFLFEAYYIFTVHRLLVLDVFMGESHQGEILEVKLIGGQMDNVILINDEYVPLTVGDVLVLFLETYDIENMPASLLNPVQSVYRFTPSQANAIGSLERTRQYDNFSSTSKDYYVIESLNANNTLTLTINDLLNIAESSR